MKTSVNIFQRRTLAPLVAIIALSAALPASAASSLSFNSIPVSDAVAQIDNQLGVTISLKQGINPNARVSFSVSDLQGPGARLDAINQLANALNADFQKVIVVRSASADASTPAPIMDSDAPVHFKAGTMSVRDAIQTVAEVDSAVAKMTENIDGSVTFNGDEMTVKQAAASIARQSHTLWKTFYAITPRNGAGSTAGKIIGYTGAGKPILELPYRTFREATTPPPPVVDPAAVNPDGSPVDPNVANAAPAYPPMAYNPYFGYYGGNYNPYYQNGIVNTGGSGFSAPGVTVLPGWPGYGFNGPTVINTSPTYYPYR
jgi:hypothetical protein